MEKKKLAIRSTKKIPNIEIAFVARIVKILKVLSFELIFESEIQVYLTQNMTNK